MNKADKDKVIAALEVAYKQNGCDMVLTGEELRNRIIPALNIMRGLAEDSEPEILHRMKYHHFIDDDGTEDYELFPMNCTECKECIDVLIVRASPQAAQTDRTGNKR